MFDNWGNFIKGRVIQGPTDITSLFSDWPDDFADVHAAVPHPNGYYYFFYGGRYVKVNWDSGVLDGYPMAIRDGWKNWPSGDDWGSISSAYYHRDRGKIYMFARKEYIRYTPSVGCDGGYPKKVEDEYMQISDGWLPFQATYYDEQYGHTVMVFSTGHAASYTSGSVPVIYDKLGENDDGETPPKDWPSDWTSVGGMIRRIAGNLDDNHVYCFKGRQYVVVSCEGPWD